ncbi:MAG: hypothetical protein KIT09_16055 [Bryobacteraceae bacterium]|nr:hypothetical protein [Bryobacteraceae bacterium]
MRYRRGTIAISESTDIPILRTVYRAGHLTIRQLYEHLHPTGLTKNRWDSFNRRLRMLAAHEFVLRTAVVGMESDVVSLGETGELLLQGRERLLVERASRTNGRSKRSQVWHDVELFTIHLALRQSGIIRDWQYEPEIRADNDFTTFGYAKDYDAVVTVQCEGRAGRIALEYERTPKSSREYERITALTNREANLDTFLYLVSSIQLKSYLLHCLRRSTRRMYVALADEFCRSPLEATLIDTHSQRSWRLFECLEESKPE